MNYLAEIPYGTYWSTPFAKWQGSLAHLHSVEFAAAVARDELARREISPEVFDYGVLGLTVPQKGSFYGLPWFAGLIGAPQVGGPTVSQACATGVRSLFTGAQEIGAGLATCALVAACDRTSNGPHIYYPAPFAPGGTGAAENWVLDNFGCDPLGGHAMVATAENVARRYGLTTEEQHEIVLRRQEQYGMALADDRAFQRRYMSLPFSVPDQGFRKEKAKLEGDEGVYPTTAEGLARLKPVIENGTVTYGGQTHPADGNAALVLATSDRARELSREPGIAVRLLGFGLARTDLAHMPMAPVPATRVALENAGLSVDDIDAIKTHNPFAVNDLVLARDLGVDATSMNNYGCSLIWGHPQGPTGLRGVIELIEELALRGGGRGLFTGCAAGDTAMSVVIEVTDRG
ncbi:thiolase family protein [Microbaculum sp. A6E488]|uniref:Thiolase family protein n=1 Tax=Microbaculum marinisediminis TaxID=2931392 RepID=A0AAW5R2E2_9HYPH|nr:thiolase family protein [Microbaculum sp. A6E488]MCT8973525.1 thiolase family protein [Microbaculum sp. A6E488]